MQEKRLGTTRHVDTGKVVIGSAYQRPTRSMDRDEEIIQSILLGIRPTAHERLATWCAAGVLVVVLLLLVVKV